MNHIIKLFVLMGILFQFTFAQETKIYTQEFPREELKKQNSTIAALAAKEMAKTLPQKVDAYTTITKITNKNATLVYTFEIDTGAKSDALVIKEDRSRMHRAVTQGLCRSANKFLFAGINISYIYRSKKTKKILFQFNITQDKCMNVASR